MSRFLFALNAVGTVLVFALSIHCIRATFDPDRFGDLFTLLHGIAFAVVGCIGVVMGVSML